MSASLALRDATFAELDTVTLYALLRLRVDVFVVEQRCPYPELDGRDTEPGTVHLWLEHRPPAGAAERSPRSSGRSLEEPDGVPVAYLRLLDEPDGRARIGRVVVAPSARGAGHARRLLAAALDRLGERESVLNAQSHLVGFYASHGFTPTGPAYLEDGIPHTPMRRAGPAQHRRPYDKADEHEATPPPAQRHF